MMLGLWTPTRADRIARALELAELAPGERFVDLGCGDGRVLLAAARRGADVVGIEADRALADKARALLGAIGASGRVMVGDIFDTHVEADVVFAFLTPATLQRLAPRLARLAPGTRVVTPEIAVEGWRPHARHGDCFLYAMPPNVDTRAAEPGWEAYGVLAAVRARAPTVTSVRLHHPGGHVAVAVKGPVAHVVSVFAGLEFADGPRPLAVDIRWNGCEPGAVVTGALDCAEVGAFAIVGIYVSGFNGSWPLDDSRTSAEISSLLRSSTDLG